MLSQIVYVCDLGFVYVSFLTFEPTSQFLANLTEKCSCYKITRFLKMEKRGKKKSL